MIVFGQEIVSNSTEKSARNLFLLSIPALIIAWAPIEFEAITFLGMSFRRETVGYILLVLVPLQTIYLVTNWLADLQASKVNEDKYSIWFMGRPETVPEAITKGIERWRKYDSELQESSEGNPEQLDKLVKVRENASNHLNVLADLYGKAFKEHERLRFWQLFVLRVNNLARPIIAGIIAVLVWLPWSLFP